MPPDFAELLKACDRLMFVTVTRGILDAGQSSRGAWSREQLELLGVPWPPARGWRGRLEGTRLPGSTVAAFLRLKDAHLPGAGPNLFGGSAEDANP